MSSTAAVATLVGVDEQSRVLLHVRGRVQGVGFRFWTRARAEELGLAGHARNLPDGRVEVLAQGPRAQLEQLERLLREQPSTSSRPGHVQDVATQWGPAQQHLQGFRTR